MESVGRRAFALRSGGVVLTHTGPAYSIGYQSLSSFWAQSDIFPGDPGPFRWRHFWNPVKLHCGILVLAGASGAWGGEALSAGGAGR